MALEAWMWVAFGVFVVAMLLVDLLAFGGRGGQVLAPARRRLERRLDAARRRASPASSGRGRAARPPRSTWPAS